jgi:hypothetical protein
MSASKLDVRVRGGEVRRKKRKLELRAEWPSSGEGESAELEIRHGLGELRHVFVPHLTPEPGFVAGDFVFRAPVVLLADRRRALALIPDLDDVRAADGWRAWLDYDHEAGVVTIGAGAYRTEGHVFFVKAPVECRGQRARLRVHVLESDDPKVVADPYRWVARWLWKRWGRSGHRDHAPLALAPFMRWVTRWAFSSEGWGDTVWQSFELSGAPAGAPVFIVDVTRHPSAPPEKRRWREARSVWNQAWFSTQRSANGLLRHARQVGSADLADRARRMTEIALAAPESDGLFPSVLLSTAHASASDDEAWTSARWSNSDRRPPSVSEQACHVVDAAFTARMLLEWHALTGEPRALERVHRFATRLVALQSESGAFPGWIEPDGRIAPELAESAETAVGVKLLFELAAREPEQHAWMKAARAGLAFLAGVIAGARWEDFETYYSCAPWGAPELCGRRVPRNGVYKQNTLSIAWCAEAMLAAFVATRKRRYLRLAERCASELALYQSVWDPPWLPAPAHGGFGVMNADSEWNDARQSLFAPLFLDLYRHTRDETLKERGLAALRASFSMLYCPENAALAKAYERRFPFFGAESYGFMMENQGHGAGDPIGDFCIFTWGNGSALATAATVIDEYSDIDEIARLSSS